MVTGLFINMLYKSNLISDTNSTRELPVDVNTLSDDVLYSVNEDSIFNYYSFNIANSSVNIYNY